MAGNTKFTGFGPKNQVTLERWGETATAELPGPAIEVLREMVFDDLPKRPPSQVPKVGITYNERLGQIEFHMAPERARLLADLLNQIELDDLDDISVVDQWHESLRGAVKDHEHFTDIQGEPGVPGDDTTEA